MLSGDCNVCINVKLPSYSATCVKCGLSRKNYQPITNTDRIRNMDDYDLAIFLENVSCKHADTENWFDWLRQEVDK